MPAQHSPAGSFARGSVAFFITSADNGPAIIDSQSSNDITVVSSAGQIGLWAVGPKPNISKPHPEHKIYPYLLRGLTIDRPNQVWATDITYIRMRHGFLYLCAILDWATRKVLSWRLSNTLTSDFCTAALREAIARYGTPEIFNTDQGSQFTSAEFAGVLAEHKIRISMDGRGRCHDNIFVERLWWTVKHEWVYLRPCDNGIEQRKSLADCSDWYNRRRPHQSLGWKTPNETYFDALAEAQPMRAWYARKAMHCGFVDSRLCRFPPDHASAVPYGQAMDNAPRCPPLAHRSAAAHKLHSARPDRDKIRESQNHLYGSALSLFHPGGRPSYRDHRIC